jgi:hypothetical protein
MTSKSTTSSATPSGDGQRGPDEPRQPEHPADSRFDPADFKAVDEPTPAAADGRAHAALNPFDPISLRLTEDQAAGPEVKKPLLTVPVRKPNRDWWVRTHPDEGYRLPTKILEVSGKGISREMYLVSPALWFALALEVTFRPKLLVTAINRDGDLFLWELNLPRPDGRLDEWSRTALEAAKLSVTSWIRVTANQGLGAYTVLQAAGNLPEPQWPATPFPEILDRAFQDRKIDHRDHPVLRRLRGEV